MFQLPPEPPTIRIQVLSLFHPRTILLDHRPITAPATLSLPPKTFTLTVPGKLTRSYTGALEITTMRDELQIILTLSTEQAVASIVAAESPPHAPIESLKAQAVAARSYLLAAQPALSCDTTRCQYLRAAPPPGSPAALATAATSHQVLLFHPLDAPPTIVLAMYSRSCGGRTRAHPTGPATYPFYSVRCDYCLRHPETWTRLAPSTQTETARLAFNRTHGWAAIPSNTHTTVAGWMHGRGTGHGIGLCQLGAADLAAHGQSYGEILAHFYPNTALTTIP